MRALALAALSLACASCSAVVSFHECDTDADCGTVANGTQLYCTDDHMCVGAIPDYKLCALSPTPANQASIPDGALVIGGLYRTSGPNDVNDHTFRRAADLAASEFLAAGYNVAHVVCDTAGDPGQAARAYDVVIDRFGANVIVGPDTSDEVFEVAKEVKARGVPLISPSATNPDISGLDDDDLVWRTAASDNLQAKVLATLAPSTVSIDIVYDAGSKYATGLKNAFVADFPGQSNPIMFTGGDDNSRNAAVATASADAPAFALLIADFDAPPLMAAVAKAPGLATTQFLMTDSAKKPSLWEQLGGDYTVMNRVRGTGPANPAFSDPSGKAFMVMQTNYKATYMGEDPAETAFVGNAYDAFYVAAFAGLALPSDKRGGQNIVANLARMSDQMATTVPVGPNSINSGVTPLQMGQTINLVGTSGPIDFDASSGDVLSAPIEKWSVDTTGTTPVFRTDSIVVP